MFGKHIKFREKSKCLLKFKNLDENRRNLLQNNVLLAKIENQPVQIIKVEHLFE